MRRWPQWQFGASLAKPATVAPAAPHPANDSAGKLLNTVGTPCLCPDLNLRRWLWGASHGHHRRVTARLATNQFHGLLHPTAASGSMERPQHPS
eukprot:CAMPEP_0204501696 /NCGR_PEP_ID=MMETSP0471-20130131/99720_1 /ASSEMBLY_ACC=CAM_ASM_000602 /TAXON_ID=2969 /ORGANISM="Oxyrrhis marina" /LENGTH=93 /DNA_ID=CAMNT_0051506379 /DNA_START=160 /DNA_END=438 /DNA_ORIENTATION=-